MALAMKTGTGASRSDEHVLVKGQVLLGVVVLAELGAEPVREGGVDGGDVFAEFSFGEGRTAASGLGGDGHGEAFVIGAGPEGGFAQAGMSDDGDALRIEAVILGFDIVHDSAQAPGPGADGAPGIGGAVGVARAWEEGMDAIAEAVMEVRVQIAVVGGHQCEAVLNQHLGRPRFSGLAAAGSRGLAVFAAEFLLVANGRLREEDGRVIEYGMVAVEIKSEKGRRRLGGSGWAEDKQVEEVFVGLVVKVISPVGGWLFRRAVALFLELCMEAWRAAGHDAVHFFGEQVEDFGAPGRPLRGVGDAVAITGGQDVWQRIGRYLAFVIVECERRRDDGFWVGGNVIAVFAHGWFKEGEVIRSGGRVFVILQPAVDDFRLHRDFSHREAEELLQSGQGFVLLQDKVFQSHFDPVFRPRGCLDQVVLIFPGDGAAAAFVQGSRVGDAEALHVVGHVAADDAVARIANPEDKFSVREKARYPGEAEGRFRDFPTSQGGVAAEDGFQEGIK